MAATQRARAFRDEGCGDHERRRDRHLDREDEEEPERRETFWGTPEESAGEDIYSRQSERSYPRCIRTSIGAPFRMVW